MCTHFYHNLSVRLEMCGTGQLVCKNSGVCALSTIDQSTHVCNCLTGFAGDDCSAIVCGTEGNACYNGGHCNETSGTCVCPPPLTSDDCRGSTCVIVFQNESNCSSSRYLRCGNTK